MLQSGGQFSYRSDDRFQTGWLGHQRLAGLQAIGKAVRPTRDIWSGPARLTFHGIDVLRDGEHQGSGAVRYNLTFRRIG